MGSQWATETLRQFLSKRNCLTMVIESVHGGTAGTDPRTALSIKKTHPEGKEGTEVKVLSGYI